MVMALYSVAEAIEARAVDRARGAIKSLMAMVPEDADVQQPDGSWRRVLSKDVALGTVVSASRRAIPTGWHREAGTWRGGSIARNGESIPVDKTIGDAIFAGTINQVGELEVQVTAPASDGTLAASSMPWKKHKARVRPRNASLTNLLPTTPRRVLPGISHRCIHALADGVDVDASDLQGAGIIGHCLSLRVGDFYTCNRGEWTGCCGSTWHPHQGRRVSGAGTENKGICIGQNRHDHRWQTQTGRVLALNNDAERGSLEQIAASLATRSDHPVSKAIAEGLPTSTLDVGDSMQWWAAARRVLS